MGPQTCHPVPGPGQTGTLVKDWTFIASNINAAAYTSDWPVDFAALLEDATNYVSVRAWDVSGATTTQSDVFYVHKDISEYEEKVVGKLSARVAACVGGGIAASVAAAAAQQP